MPVLVTRGDYVDAALRILAEDGAAGLKVGRLCHALGVTTGSFYHYYDGLDSFVGELLAHWEQEQTVAHALLAEATRDPHEAIAVLKASAIQLPHAAESAIRAWAHRDPQVAAAQRRVDVRRHEALASVIGRVVPEPQRVQRLATLCMRVLVGFQQSGDPNDTAEITQLADELEQFILRDAHYS